MGKLNQFEDESIETHTKEEDELVIDEMVNDDEIVTLCKLVVAGMADDKAIIHMIDDIYFRAIARARKKLREQDE